MAVTIITLVTGERYEVEGSPESVGASRGSIMQLAWLSEAGTGRPIAVNPLHVVALQAAAADG